MTESSAMAMLAIRREQNRLHVRLGGDWLMATPNRPMVGEVILALDETHANRVVLEDGGIRTWDSSLLLFLYQLKELCRQRNIDLNCHGLPEGLRRLLHLATAVTPTSTTRTSRKGNWLEWVGLQTLNLIDQTYDFVNFIGETALSALRLLRGRARFRLQDLWLLLQECGPSALPIVTLIALLMGLILAYVGAIQLQMFGAQIYVANLVGLGTLREMGAMMTAVIMAGRTGAAYAAQLGTMQVNEEIDALKTLGMSPMEFLVLPRMIALILMVPLLTLYADLVGLLGGGLAAVSVFDLTMLEYVTQTRNALDLQDLSVGLIKAAVFGVLIATAGCIRGIQCRRSAQAVGEATTSAVVSAIVAIVVADSLLTILFTQLGI
ncbi:MAG TPA: MlaE family lipid ABC transporter permease subunit [Methylothermaceae bacterium]|nr:MlaE family lipid ABC transporter permease subunit [Methylothermaceae bacterium]